MRIKSTQNYEIDYSYIVYHQHLFMEASVIHNSAGGRNWKFCLINYSLAYISAHARTTANDIILHDPERSKRCHLLCIEDH